MTPETKFANKVCKAFEKAGWTTINMEALGDGVPDRQISYKYYTFVLEFKREDNWLTPNQEAWIKKEWKNNLPLFIITKKKNLIEIDRIIYSEKQSNRYSVFVGKLKNEIEIINYFTSFMSEEWDYLV